MFSPEPVVGTKDYLIYDIHADYLDARPRCKFGTDTHDSILLYAFGKYHASRRNKPFEIGVGGDRPVV